MSPKDIGLPWKDKCPECRQYTLFHAKPDEGEPDYNVFCRGCGAMLKMTVESPNTVGNTTERKITMTSVGPRKVQSMSIDYYADGPIAVKREIGLGDLLMASVPLHAAKLANPANPTYYCSYNPRPLPNREWLLGIPWADEVVEARPADVPRERYVDLQIAYQFDFGWWGGKSERIDVALGRAGVPPDLWDEAGRPDYCPAPESFERGRAWRASADIPDDDKMIWVSAHSLGAVGRRSLPVAYFGELLARVLTETDAWVVGDVAAARDHLPEGTDASRLVHHQVDCNELVDLLYQADLLLTTDTGPLHLGTCFGTPTIAWFSSSPPWSRISYYPNAVGLANPDLCPRKMWPCTANGRPHCPSAKCMEVELDTVMKLVHERLEAPPVVRVLGPPAHRDPEGFTELAVAEIALGEADVRYIPTTPNVGWPMDGPGSIVIDEGRTRREP